MRTMDTTTFRLAGKIHHYYLGEHDFVYVKTDPYRVMSAGTEVSIYICAGNFLIVFSRE